MTATRATAASSIRAPFIAVQGRIPATASGSAALMDVLASSRFRGGCSRSNSPLDFELARLSIGRSLPTAATVPSRTSRLSLAEPTSVAEHATHAPTSADLERAAKFTREPYVYEGEDPATALAPGSPRRVALDAALAELDSGLQAPLGGVAALVLAAARPRAAAQRGGAPPGRRHRALRPPGRRAVGHADRPARRGAAQRQRQRLERRPVRRGDRRAGARRHPGRGARTRTTTSPRSRRTGAPTPTKTTTPSSTSSPRTPTRPSASGSSTPRAPARRSPRSASPRPPAPAAC